MESHDKNDSEKSLGLSARILFVAIKLNIFTFMLTIFSTYIIYIPILSEYAKLGFNYGNTILLMALIFNLITLPLSMLSSDPKNSPSWINIRNRRKN